MNIPLVYIMDLIVGMFNFIYHMNIVIKTGVYIITIIYHGLNCWDV